MPRIHPVSYMLYNLMAVFIVAWSLTSTTSLAQLLMWHFFRKPPGAGPYAAREWLTAIFWLLFWTHGWFSYALRADAQHGERGSPGRQYLHLGGAMVRALFIAANPHDTLPTQTLPRMAKLLPWHSQRFTWDDFRVLGPSIAVTCVTLPPALAMAIDFEREFIGQAGIQAPRVQSWRLPWRTLRNALAKVTLTALFAALWIFYGEDGLGWILVDWALANQRDQQTGRLLLPDGRPLTSRILAVSGLQYMLTAATVWRLQPQEERTLVARMVQVLFTLVMVLALQVGPRLSWVFFSRNEADIAVETESPALFNMFFAMAIVSYRTAAEAVDWVDRRARPVEQERKDQRTD